MVERDLAKVEVAGSSPVIRSILFKRLAKASLFLFFRERNIYMRKNIIIVLLSVMLVSVFVLFTDFSSVEDYYLEHAEDIAEDSETVFISIRCDTILQNMEKLEKELYDFVPDDGVILDRSEYVLREGDSVFDILTRAVRSNRIQMEYKGAENVYIEGINYIYEFSCGKLSGWTYLVNGRSPSVAASMYILEDGDVIEWVYTCDLGRDIPTS